jgi:hypothetical protein
VSQWTFQVGLNVTVDETWVDVTSRHLKNCILNESPNKFDLHQHEVNLLNIAKYVCMHTVGKLIKELHLFTTRYSLCSATSFRPEVLQAPGWRLLSGLASSHASGPASSPSSNPFSSQASSLLLDLASSAASSPAASSQASSLSSSLATSPAESIQASSLASDPASSPVSSQVYSKA